MTERFEPTLDLRIYLATVHRLASAWGYVSVEAATVERQATADLAWETLWYIEATGRVPVLPETSLAAADELMGGRHKRGEEVAEVLGDEGVYGATYRVAARALARGTWPPDGPNPGPSGPDSGPGSSLGVPNSPK